MIMEENDFKTLLKQSTINTSDGFTDKLIMKLEAEKSSLSIPKRSEIISLRYPLFIIFSSGICFMLLLFFDLLPTFNLMNYHVQLRSTPFLIIIILALFIGVNHLLNLKIQAKHRLGL